MFDYNDVSLVDFLFLASIKILVFLAFIVMTLTPEKLVIAEKFCHEREAVSKTEFTLGTNLLSSFSKLFFVY